MSAPVKSPRRRPPALNRSLIAPGDDLSVILATTSHAKRRGRPITSEMLGAVLAGAFIALDTSMQLAAVTGEDRLILLANQFSELGRHASQCPALAETMCAASRVLMMTEEDA